MGLTGFNRRRRALAAEAGVASAAPAAVREADIELVDEPPREGRGAGKGAWVAFAATVPGLVFTEDDTRDEIIAKYDALVAENTRKLEEQALAAAGDAQSAPQSESDQNDGDADSTAEAGADDGSDNESDDAEA